MDEVIPTLIRQGSVGGKVALGNQSECPFGSSPPFTVGYAGLGLVLSVGSRVGFPPKCRSTRVPWVEFGHDDSKNRSIMVGSLVLSMVKVYTDEVQVSIRAGPFRVLKIDFSSIIYCSYAPRFGCSFYPLAGLPRFLLVM